MQIQIARVLMASIAGIVAFGDLGCGCGPTSEKQPTGDEPRRYAEKVCAAIDDCECFNHFGTTSLCEDELETRFTSFVEAGLELDPDCFELMDDDTVGDCSPVPVGPQEWRCTVLRGDQKLGEPCADHELELAPFEVNDCEEGLTCWNGKCYPQEDSPPNLEEGDACTSDAPLTCVGITSMLYCSAEGSCAVQPMIGEACTSPFACAIEIGDNGTSTYCMGWADDRAGTCSNQSTYAEPCDPLEAFSCSGAGDPRGAWCDPAQDVCVPGGPGICRFMDFPRARPRSG